MNPGRYRNMCYSTQNIISEKAKEIRIFQHFNHFAKFKTEMSVLVSLRTSPLQMKDVHSLWATKYYLIQVLNMEIEDMRDIQTYDTAIWAVRWIWWDWVKQWNEHMLQLLLSSQPIRKLRLWSFFTHVFVVVLLFQEIKGKSVFGRHREQQVYNTIFSEMCSSTTFLWI